MIGDPKIPSAATPLACAQSIFAQLVELGARYDAAPVFPAESMKLLRDVGLHRTFAPVPAGGENFASRREQYACMTAILRIIGRADLSIGRLFEGHVNALLLFDWFATSPQLSTLRATLSAGDFYGVWATEPQPGVKLRDGKNEMTLEGAKSFATGAGGLRHAIITVQPLAGARRLAIVEADDLARTDLTGWRVRGMRATGSGSYDLSDMVVRELDLLGTPGQYDEDPNFTTGAWRFTAVQLGGIEALLSAAREAMSDSARQDPLQRAKFADAVAATRTAYLWVRECAQRAADRVSDGPAFARMTRGVVERAALDVMELTSRLVGTRSAMDGERIDKIHRDLSLYLRQAGPDFAKDEAAIAWLDHDAWGDGDELW
jgi:alkylation response protein AidB-like acyl-CoA dehydrogenase